MTDQGCMLRAYSRDIVDAINAVRARSTPSSRRSPIRSPRNPTEIEVAHEERAAGESKYSLYKLIRLNFDLMTGFSLVPLQIFSLLGIARLAASRSACSCCHLCAASCSGRRRKACSRCSASRSS